MDFGPKILIVGIIVIVLGIWLIYSGGLDHLALMFGVPSNGHQYDAANSDNIETMRTGLIVMYQRPGEIYHISDMEFKTNVKYSNALATSAIASGTVVYECWDSDYCSGGLNLITKDYFIVDVTICCDEDHSCKIGIGKTVSC